MNDILTHAQSLPTGKYLTLDRANVKGGEGVKIGLEEQGITNATSKYPVLADELATGVILLYNRKTKTAAMVHPENPSSWEPLEAMVKKIRSNPADQVDVHVIGFGSVKAEPHSEFTQEVNELARQSLVELLQFADRNNLALKTFDTHNKAFPDSVAIDARNGKLLYGGRMINDFRQSGNTRKPDPISDFDLNPSHGDFDGTAKQYQKGRGGVAG